MFRMFHFLLRTTRQGDRWGESVLFKNVYSPLDKPAIVETQSRKVLVYIGAAPASSMAYTWHLWQESSQKSFVVLLIRQGLIDLSILKTENYSTFLIVSISTIFFCIISKKPFRNLSLSFCVICWKVIRSLSIKIWSDRTSNCSVEEKYEQ